MKVLTLKQPWATLIADGLKVVEIRTWSTTFRGPLAIHAGRGEDVNGLLSAVRLIKGMDEVRAFESRVVADRGKIIATSRLLDVVPYTRFDDFAHDWRRHLNDENAWERGLFGWVLADVSRLAEPVKARGQLGLWEVFDDERLRGSARA